MTYLAIVDGSAQFGGSSSLRTWLFAVIRNQARSRWRRARQSLRMLARLAAFAPDAPAHTDIPAAMPRVEVSRIVEAWASLPARQREVLDLVFYRDLSIAEAADVLGVTLGTARVHYERGKTALRRLLTQPELAR